MTTSLIDKNKQDNIDLLQIEYFSDLPISDKEIVVIEDNNTIAITIRKFLTRLGFENICICKESSEGVKIFSDFINNEKNVPIIIDTSVSNNFENIIKEILETQPSANIIVITTKEKTDPQIIRLFNTGISSVINKPLIFGDLKKSLLNIFEKDQENGNIKTEKLDFIINTHNQISQNKIKDIFKFEQEKIENLIKNAIDNRKIITDKEILEATCNQCDSANITYISECPQCKGVNFKQQNLVEHYSCGEVFPKEVNENMCPKCNKTIGTVGKDFREFTDYYVCSSCNDRFPRPLFRFVCFNCGNSFIEKTAKWKKSKCYKIQK